MLKLVKGRSKSGKTEYLRNYLSALALSGEDKLLMLVPDQQTFETEKAFLELLGPKYALNVKVLGFSRLCDYVFEKTGYSISALADDSVKTLVMSMALEDTSDFMKLYGDKALTPKLLSTMLDARRELMRNKVDAEAMVNLSSEDDPLLSEKLHDVNLVMSAYEAILNSSFEDPDGELSIACDLLRSHKLFEDYIICLDSYLSFNQQEYDVIELLMLQSREFLVSFSDDVSVGEDSIFDVSRLTASKLRSIASENGISVGAPVICDYDGYFKSSVISVIEENVFRGKSLPEKTEPKTDDSVCIYNAKDIYEESDFVARNIKRLVMEEKYRYNDFAVVCRNVSAYSGIVDATLARYNIPFFMDTPGHIHSKPLVKFINACFNCVISSFSKDSVLAVFKSGLISADQLDISLFENYVFTWNISGKGFFSEFTANPRGFADNFTTSDLYELSKVENLRKSVIEPLLMFRDNIRNADVRGVCTEIYKLLLSLSVDEKVKTLCNSLDSGGHHQLSEEQTRLWQVFTDTLDRTVMVAGDRRFAPKRFLELLNLQFTAQDMAFIPRASDQVTVGDIERLRLSDKKVVFVIGAIEGEFPKAYSDSGIFTSSERETLTRMGVLADTSVVTWVLKEQYLCYYALTSASEKLFVSYPASSLAGTIYQPSQMITELRSVYPEISFVQYSDVSAFDRLWSAKPSFAQYSSRIGSTDRLTESLEKYYSEDEFYNASANAIRRAATRAPFVINDKKNAENLFGKNMNLSASQVESFHLCRFKYFCNYGLRVRERREASIDAMEYGSLVHYILEKFIAKYSKSEMLAIGDNDVSDDVKAFMAEYADMHFGGAENKTERFLYLFNRVSEYVKKLINHIIQELIQSSFDPAAFELDIGNDIPAYELTLPTGQKVTIRGKVDRADIMKKDGKVYIRIVDYKTGSKVFKLSDVMYGLNLQMLIYLSALTQNSKDKFGTEIIPAGVLYMPATVAVINAAFSDSKEKIEKEHNKKLRMNGLILSDLDVLEGMERDASGVYIPVSSKGEKITGTDNLATLEEFGAIFSRIDKFVSEMAQELYKGSVEAVPAKIGYDACEYCPYTSVCGHRDGDPTRGIYKLDRKEILKELGLNDIEEEVSE